MQLVKRLSFDISSNRKTDFLLNGNESWIPGIVGGKFQDSAETVTGSAVASELEIYS